MTCVLGENTSPVGEGGAEFNARDAQKKWNAKNDFGNFRLPLARAEDPFDFDNNPPYRLTNVKTFIGIKTPAPTSMNEVRARRGRQRTGPTKLT